jgi:LAS superfamily LD-carboxypeptidase LdcB
VAVRTRSHYIPVSLSQQLGNRHVTVRSRSVRRLIAAATTAAVVGAVPMLAPAPTAAAPAQEEPGAGTEGGTTGTVIAPDEILRAGVSDVSSSLTERSAEVQTQLDATDAAQVAAADAAAALTAADAAVAATEQQITSLNDQTDQVVVDSFINPPSENAIETLAAPTLAESTVRQAILDRQTDANVEALDELEAAHEQLAAQKETQDEAAAAAETTAAQAAAARDDLVSTLSDEAYFVYLVQERLAANLAEASALESVDPAAAEALRAREGELSATLGTIVAGRQQQAAAQAAMEQALRDAAARAAARSTRSSSSSSGGRTLGPASGNLADVTCPGGGSITVDSSISSSLASMLDAAAADGNDLCGGGYRDPSAQIALRRANCGSSDYAIYEAPSSSCSPPTAPPGTSNHEQGTAIDFTCNGGGTLSRSSPCFTWLRSNAASYGFYNLPSEPWHWSVDGT